MIIYNTTFNVAPGKEDVFIDFLKQEFILDCLNSKLVSNPRFMKLLGDLPDEGSTYSLQFDCKNLDNCLTFETEHIPVLQDGIIEKYGDQVLFFTSILEVIW